MQSVSGGDHALTRFWTPLRHHPTQQELLHSIARFNVVPAGRRSGKTSIGIRRLAIRALEESNPGAWYLMCGPTEGQARNIFWSSLKDLFPREFIRNVSPGRLTVQLITGVEITVVGLDAPQRIEGRPVRHALLDEYGNMRPQVWAAHLRPALSDLRGTADFIGVPEGRNHYYDLYMRALEDDTGVWAGFTWESADILDEEEIEQAKLDMDERMFDQEYRAKFINFAGRVYYAFDRSVHCKPGLAKLYDPDKELCFCFDFNNSPGVAVVVQEIKGNTCVIGEVYIERDSNSMLVAEKLGEAWGEHRGDVRLYGDASGGAMVSSAVAGSDWDIVRQVLRQYFGSRVATRVPNANPREVARINAMNTRIKNMKGDVRFYIDPDAAPKTVRDLDSVRYKGGKIHKPSNPDDPESKLTHLTDGLGYYVHKRFPLAGGGTITRRAG